jgi:hypothetical protein
MKNAWYLVCESSMRWLISVALLLTYAQAQSSASGVTFAKAETIPSPVLYPTSMAAGDLSVGGEVGFGVVGNEEPGLCASFGVPKNPSPTLAPWNCSGFAGDAPVQVVFADVNLDGNMDAVATDADLPLVTVGLGNGKGQFRPDAGLYAQCGYATEAVAVADINGDGIPDIVATVLGVANNPSCLAIFLGEGKGKFSKAQEISSGGSTPFSVAIGDLNHDGIPDLVIGNYGLPFYGDYGDVAVLLGNGDGTFQKPRHFAGLRDPFQVILVDLNGDGNLDIAAVANDQAVVWIALGKGDGTFYPGNSYPAGDEPISIITADFNGDGIPDLAVANYVNPKPCYVSVLLGNGDGAFQKPTHYSVGVSPQQIVTAHFTGDGKPDIATINGGDSTISILLNTTQFPSK